MVWLLDIRHPPSADDREFQDLLAETGLPVLVALTKGDKLAPARRRAAAADRAGELGMEPEALLVTSTHTGLGIADLGQSILAAVT